MLLIFAEVYDSNPYNLQISCHIILYHNIQSVMFIAKKSPPRNISLYSFSHHILFFFLNNYINNNKSHNMNKPNFIFLVINFFYGLISYKCLSLTGIYSKCVDVMKQQPFQEPPVLYSRGQQCHKYGFTVNQTYIVQMEEDIMNWPQAFISGMCVAVKTWWDLSWITENSKLKGSTHKIIWIHLISQSI